MRSAVHCSSPISRHGFDFGPRGYSSRAPHSPIWHQRGVSGPREGEPLISTRLLPPRWRIRITGGRTPSSEDPTGRSTSPHSFMGCRSRSASLPARRDGRSSRTAASHPTRCRRTQCHSIPKRCPSLAPVSFSVGVSFQDGRRYVLLSR